MLILAVNSLFLSLFISRLTLVTLLLLVLASQSPHASPMLVCVCGLCPWTEVKWISYSLKCLSSSCCLCVCLYVCLRMESKCYFQMCAFIKAQGRVLYAYMCVTVCLFSLRTEEGPCMFSPASDCPWHTHKRISTHLTACICVCVCVCSADEVHVCVSTRTSDSASVLMFPQDKQCHPTLLSIRWANWHWLCAGHALTNKTHAKLHLWIILHMQNDTCVSKFLSQDGYAWPKSIHMESTVGRRAPEQLPQQLQLEQLAGIPWLK